MKTFSRTSLFGNLGADAEVRPLSEEVLAFKFRVATHHKLHRKGQLVDHTEWETVQTVCKSGPMADFLRRNLLKGMEVFVEGPSITDKVEHDDGSIKDYRSIRAYPEDIRIMGPKKESAPSRTIERADPDDWAPPIRDRSPEPMRSGNSLPPSAVPVQPIAPNPIGFSRSGQAYRDRDDGTPEPLFDPPAPVTRRATKNLFDT